MEVKPCKFDAVERKIVRCTPALATRFVNMKRLIGEREMMKKNIDDLKKQLMSGTFHAPRWACAVLDGEEYRVNGQHTSNILKELNKDCRHFDIIYEKYHLKNAVELAELWMTYDGPIGVRNPNQIYRAYASAFESLKDVPDKVTRIATGGISRRKTYGGMNGSTTPFERAAEIANNQPFILWFSGMVDHHWKKKDQKPNLLKCPIAGAMMATHEKYPKASTQFWRDVVNDSGVSPKGGDRQLRTFLLMNKIGRGGSTEMDYYFNCVDCFNHWLEGKDVKSMRSNKDIKSWHTIEVIDLPGVEERFANVK